MATQKTPIGLEYWELGDLDWHEPYEATCLRLDALAPLRELLVRPEQVPSSSLSVRILAGTVVARSGLSAEVAETIYALPASAASKVWAEADGTIADGAAWPSDRDVVRLAAVTTAATAVTAIVDVRRGLFAYGLDQAIAPGDAKYVLQQAHADLPNGQALGALAGGLMKVAATTGVISVAVPGAAIADATDEATAISGLNSLLASMRAHGLIAT